MVESKRKPEGTPKTPKAADDETFLFMGTRIPLDSTTAKPVSAPDLNSTVPESQQAPPPTNTSERAAASPESASEAAENPPSSKSSFDFEPFAGSSKPGSSSRIFILGAALVIAGVAAFIAWNRFGSIEARIARAANSGHLVWPEGSSAYDLFQPLKAEGLSPVTRDKLSREVLPKLSQEGDTFLTKMYKGSDLTESEINQLVRIYEWAADLDPQDNSLRARRAYAVGRRAVFKKTDAEALSAFREAFQNDSQWPLPFYELARLQARAGDDASAEYYYQQAVQLNPKWVLPQLNLASLYLERNRLAEAELGYRRATEADPSLAAPWYFLGQLYQRQKRKVEAISAYERAIQLATEHPSSTLSVDEIRNLLEKIR